ncbi:MAG: hypothetical protein GY705_31115, partial [Bacteroidetes bacterium]|nr:hypothetical protein [Bacteroidota bacterium]
LVSYWNPKTKKNVVLLNPSEVSQMFNFFKNKKISQFGYLTEGDPNKYYLDNLLNKSDSSHVGIEKNSSTGEKDRYSIYGLVEKKISYDDSLILFNKNKKGIEINEFMTHLGKKSSLEKVKNQILDVVVDYSKRKEQKKKILSENRLLSQMFLENRRQEAEIKGRKLEKDPISGRLGFIDPPRIINEYGTDGFDGLRSSKIDRGFKR